MKPAAFDYIAPRTLEGAVQALADSDGEARCLAGGQSLVPLMNLRLAQPSMLVDLSKLTELRAVRELDGSLAFGAMVTHRDLAESPLVADRLPLLAEAAGHIGHPAIRNRGTIGGSLAHADPVAELPCVALALDAEIVAIGPDGVRTIAASDFFQGPFTTSLAADEVLVEVRFPLPARGHGWAFLELARRRGDLAVVAVAAQLEVRNGDVSARLGLAGVADRPVRPLDVEVEVTGRPLDADSFAAAASLLLSLDPPGDLHGSSQLRRRVAVALTRRALERAAGRLNGPA
jgi:carbon-monoxide dehydrogenase medium subunit